MRHDLTSLKIFVAAAECGNLTRAAEREHLAVSAISKRVAELEALVGTPLLQRYPRGVGLTPAGQSLLHHARRMLQVLRQMEAELSEYAGRIRMLALDEPWALRQMVVVVRDPEQLSPIARALLDHLRLAAAAAA